MWREINLDMHLELTRLGINSQANIHSRLKTTSTVKWE